MLDDFDRHPWPDERGDSATFRRNTDARDAAMAADALSLVRIALSGRESLSRTCRRGVELACGLASTRSGALVGPPEAPAPLAEIGDPVAPATLRALSEASPGSRRIEDIPRRNAAIVPVRGPEGRFGTLVVVDVDFAPSACPGLEAIADALAIALAARTIATDRQRFAAQALAAQEEERRAVARDLHDGIGQSVTSLLVGLRSLESLLPPTADLEPARSLARHLASTAAATLTDIGRIARGLRPTVLDHAGLLAAARRCVDDFAHTHRIEADLQSLGLDEGQRLAEPVEIACYRILQEALTNVAKHAQATRASVILERRPDRLQIIVEDDGRGIGDPSGRSRPQLGLRGIRERVALLHGHFAVETFPGRGTTLFVRIPLEA